MIIFILNINIDKKKSEKTEDENKFHEVSNIWQCMRKKLFFSDKNYVIIMLMFNISLYSMSRALCCERERE
jgi:hypothetical protein